MGANEFIRDDHLSILLDRGAVLRFEDIVLMSVFLGKTSFDGLLGQKKLTIFE